MSGLSYFDCNVMVGRPNSLEEYSVYRPQELLAVMDRCGIEQAMAFHVGAVAFHPSSGNERIVIFCRENPRFHPVWVVLPGHTGEFPRGQALADGMKEAGVKMVKAFPSPGKHHFSLARWASGELLDVLAGCHIPLALDMGELPWEQIYALGRENPKLPLLLTNLNYRADRWLYPLMEKCPNIYLETSGLKGFLGLEAYCQNFGAQRLLFGSGLPLYSAGAAAAVVEMSDISQREKEQIAGENLRELLCKAFR